MRLDGAPSTYPLSATRLTSREVPWLCVPELPQVCLCRWRPVIITGAPRGATASESDSIIRTGALDVNARFLEVCRHFARTPMFDPDEARLPVRRALGCGVEHVRIEFEPIGRRGRAPLSQARLHRVRRARGPYCADAAGSRCAAPVARRTAVPRPPGPAPPA